MSKSGKKQLSPAGQKIFLVVFFLICASVGLGLWIPMFLLPFVEWTQMMKWKEVPCTVLRGPAGEGETLGIDFVYRYEFDGDAYESSREGTSGFFSRSVWEIKPGTRTVCYVNPREPREAVLHRDLDPAIYFWCAPLLFVIVPLFALVLGFRKLGQPSEEDPDALPALRPGAIVLAPARRSGCGLALQFGCLLFFAGAGTLIVTIPGFREGILLRLVYLVPFGLVVLLILRSLVRMFLSAFNPRVTLTVTPGTAAPGQTIEVRWETKGSAGRVKSFRIVLEGREETEARVDRKTQYKTAPFATIEVAKGGPKDLRRGLVKAKVPAKTMHSLVHGSRRIVWAFRVTGDVPTWPDVGEEYPYEVSPRKAVS